MSEILKAFLITAIVMAPLIWIARQADKKPKDLVCVESHTKVVTTVMPIYGSDSRGGPTISYMPQTITYTYCDRYKEVR